MKTLLIATKNHGKGVELSEMLSDLPIHIVSLNDFPGVEGVAETGSSFSENARLKASGYAAATGLTALADDSGLEVDALGGRPGINSARYGGEATDYKYKITALLAAMDASENRRARFVSALAISGPDGNILFETQGVCTGIITDSPRGTGGFGYDPVFVPDSYDLTFGELDGSVKRQISHRARAFRQIIPFLQDNFVV